MSNPDDHALKNALALADKRYTQLKAIEVMSQSMLGLRTERDIFGVLTKTVVQQLKWDGAVVVQLVEPTVLATFHLNQRQLRTLEKDLARLPGFLKLYADQKPLSTLGKDDMVSLALRTIFQTDEVVGAPIIFNKEVFGFLIATSQTARNRQRNNDDVIFLKTLASLAANAIENGRFVVSLLGRG